MPQDAPAAPQDAPAAVPPGAQTLGCPPTGCSTPRGAAAVTPPGEEEEDGEEGVPSKVHSMPAGAGGVPRRRLRPPLSPVPGCDEAPGYFKAMFSPPPRQPSPPLPAPGLERGRRWGDATPPIAARAPAAPRQPRGRAKVSPAAGYSRAPCCNPPGPVVTRGQPALTPSPHAPSPPTSGQPDMTLLTRCPAAGGDTPQGPGSLRSPIPSPQRHPALGTPLCAGGFSSKGAPSLTPPAQETPPLRARGKRVKSGGAKRGWSLLLPPSLAVGTALPAARCLPNISIPWHPLPPTPSA